VLDRLADVLRPALTRPPCLVSFSGGMDSSFLLAAAVRTARRDGLPDPVPITWRFTRAPAADESERQDAVVAALGLSEHIVLAAGDDLDLLGPVATDFLTTYGLRTPCNLHLHQPLMAAAGGGSLLTGAGGDQVLGGHAGGRPTLRRRVLRVLPPSVLAPVARRRDDRFPWLVAGASRRQTARWLADLRGRPASGLPRMRYESTTRFLAIATATFGEMARQHDALVGHPFLDAGVQAAFAGLLARRPGLRRQELLAAASAGQLPAVITALHPKARFHQVFVRPTTAAFIRRPPDPDLLPAGVDPAALHRFWAANPMSTATGLLIQHLWLRQHEDARPAPIGS
jgi:asparagine synthase (glutamine-hydrolysing)